MKKIMIYVLMLALPASLFCQNETIPAPKTKADYLKKSKEQKTLGFIFLGIGGASIVAVSSGNSDFGTTGAFAIIGGLSVLGSIPLFIASGVNKRNARNVSTSFKMETVPVIQKQSIIQNSYPAISLKIGL